MRLPACPAGDIVADSEKGGLNCLYSRINQELVKALNRAETKQRLGDLGIEVVAGAPEEFAATMRRAIERTAKLIKDADVRTE